MYRLDALRQRLDASTSPVGVTMLRRIKLDANGSLDGSMQPRRLDAASMSSMLILYSSCIRSLQLISCQLLVFASRKHV